MDQELKQQLDRMEKFLFEHVATKEELSELEVKVGNLTESINRLTSTVENLATQVKNFSQEHIVMKQQMLAMQEWIRKASEKIGIEFKL